MKTNMHKHSLEAYSSLSKDTMNKQQTKIYEYLLKDKENLGATRQRLSQDLHLPINVICGRCKELLELQFLSESDKADYSTGRARSILIIDYDVCDSFIEGLDAFKNINND